MEYLDVDAFLAGNQKLPCLFAHDIPHMGHLQGTGQRDIKKGNLVELPFWLGLGLLGANPELLTLHLPAAYGSRVRNALKASATSVQLKSLGGGPYFCCGALLESHIADPRLKAALHAAFLARLPEVFDQSQHATAAAGASADPAAADFVAGLDDWERELMAAGEASARAMRAWTAQTAARPARPP